MLTTAFRSLRTVAARQPVRAFTVSAARLSAAPPQVFGEGGKPGEVPTDENQATGLERFELLGKLEGVDVFDMKPLQVDRLGTMKEPIKVYSLFPERKIGCTGFPTDSHDTIWLSLNNTLKNHRCPECGSVYTMDFQGDAHAGHHH
ncbi:Cytochrome c oxidase subunit 4 [Naganishia onofrii]|uniref:Cytochrome c oxidase subunit 4 n=2 Tax=Naganishia TaxID=1851509 RepID=A0ACC2VP26_9TREE|nr:Cytochrome c oxidase subunit 4 [Naganishia friedmannii]KAJ9126086.1 Cytochrome c oxidase subunit 4 [Naganishia onofrii]